MRVDFRILVVVAAFGVGALTGYMPFIDSVEKSKRIQKSIGESHERLDLFRRRVAAANACETGDPNVAMWVIQDYLQESERDDERSPFLKEELEDSQFFIAAIQFEIAERAGREDLAASALKEALQFAHDSDMSARSEIHDAASTHEWLAGYRSRVKATLAREITSDVFGVGHRFPSGTELVCTYGAEPLKVIHP